MTKTELGHEPLAEEKLKLKGRRIVRHVTLGARAGPCYHVTAPVVTRINGRYLRLTQPARRSPQKQAQMRTFFADGVDSMHIPWAVEGLLTLLHLSLSPLLWRTGHFSVTSRSRSRHDRPYNSPLSATAWFLCTSIQYVSFKNSHFRQIQYVLMAIGPGAAVKA
jgi:hypothetical protein